MRGGILRINVDGVVPRRGWIHLPVCRHAAIAQLYPVFSDAIRKDQRAALDGDGVVEPTGDARLHREGELDAVAGFPDALDAREGARSGARFGAAVNNDGGSRGPCRDAELKLELSPTNRINRELHAATKGIFSFLDDVNESAA
jgi:hypothetical protein